jgi:hypothetical protein
MSSPRQRRTTRVVAILSAVVLAVCAGWAVLVQDVRPNACQVQPPPPRAQYLHC